MKTTRINGEDVPVIDAIKTVTTISNKLTGVKYATKKSGKT
jgi:Asp/Glu/hydantoin racemase